MTGRLRWNIKTAFRAYVAAIPDGTVQWLGSNDGIDADFFTFELSDDSGYDRIARIGTLRFAGALRFRGYRGALQVTVADPVLEIDGTGISISVDTASPGTEPDRIAFAVAELDAPGEADSPAEVHARAHAGAATITLLAPRPRLTDEGGMLLGSVYPEGTELDPLTCTLD